MSRATEDTSNANISIIRTASRWEISSSSVRLTPRMASQNLRWSSTEDAIFVNRSAAMPLHQSANAAFEHGATTLFKAANARNVPTEAPASARRAPTTSSTTPATSRRVSIPQTAATSPNPRCRVRSGIAAAMDAQDAAAMPERTRHLGFGDVAAVWGMLTRLDVAGVVDEVVGARRADAGASVGTFLALAALNRVVAPCSKAAFADWWSGIAADRFTKIASSVLDHRKFWEAMRGVSLTELEEISHRLAVRMIEMFALDVSSVALDMTNFATYIDSANEKAPIAVRGKAKQKRFDLRLVGLGLVVTRDGGIPLTWHAYPGNKPDVTQFATMIDQLGARYAAVTAQTCGAATDPTGGTRMTVVFDAGQNSVANFAHLHTARLHYVGSIPPSDCPDLLAVPAARRKVVDQARFEGLSAFETRREVYEGDRRVILTHSPTLHSGKAYSFEHTTLAKVTQNLNELAATLARGKTRRARAAVETTIKKIISDPWATRVVTWELAGDTPAAHRLAWAIDNDARQLLEAEIFGKRVLVTDHDQWPVADVVAAYRSQSEAEFSFRQLKDPHVVSFAPMHW